jgi:hypothetical protein
MGQRQSKETAQALRDGKREKLCPGAPTKYNEALADKICELISTHTCGYQQLINMYPDLKLPSQQAVYLWKHRRPGFALKYFEAKRQQSELMLHEMDAMTPGEIGRYVDNDGNERVDAPTVALLTAKLNNRKWMASRLLPKVYGDRKEVEEKIEENLELKKQLAELRAQLDAQNKKDY